MFAPSSVLKRGTAPSVFASPGLLGPVFLYRASAGCTWGFLLVFSPAVGCSCGTPIAPDLRPHSGSPAVYLSGTEATSPGGWRARRSDAPRPGTHSNFGTRSRGVAPGRRRPAPAPPPASTLGRSRQRARLPDRSAAPHRQQQRGWPLGRGYFYRITHWPLLGKRFMRPPSSAAQPRPLRQGVIVIEI
ncbi:hypothetical protein NDU88_003342 [Pleurodeles waltl]|uniref:Uncharacterized protein n=1 Tax=Pleurodeles waltl TaxID=8319 RepID=A0AAV7LF32_PLEWA|nr:hypothetical protein NDU88_003342 [Pleurodeles waltl]